MQPHEKSVDQIEGKAIEPPFLTPLVERIARTRRVPLQQLSTEDLRLLIGQRQGLPHVLHLALARLEADPFLAGDMYAGDLLIGLLEAGVHWPPETVFRARARAIAERALEHLDTVVPTRWTEGELPEPGALTEIDRDTLEPMLRQALTWLA